MKARVLIEFHDKSNFAKVYKVDDVIDITKERYDELRALKLVEEIRERVNKSNSQESKV
ncbi:MAG: hypothetical protein J1E33_03750 [Alistipes sp.]|nr:hypothetical protein [Alistipes sp.]